MLQRPVLVCTQRSPLLRQLQILWLDLILTPQLPEFLQQEHDQSMEYGLNQQLAQRVPVEQLMCTGYIPEFLLMLQQVEQLMDMAYILQMVRMILMGPVVISGSTWRAQQEQTQTMLQSLQVGMWGLEPRHLRQFSKCKVSKQQTQCLRLTQMMETMRQIHGLLKLSRQVVMP